MLSQYSNAFEFKATTICTTGIEKEDAYLVSKHKNLGIRAKWYPNTDTKDGNYDKS